MWAIDAEITSGSEWPGWIAYYHGCWGNTAGHNGTGSNDRPFAYIHTGQNKDTCADERISSNVDRRCLQWPVGLTEIVGAGAEIGLLGYAGSRMDHHFSEAVGVGAIAKASLVVKGEVPGVVNTGTLMHKWPAVNCSTKATQDEQAPEVARFWSPTAEQRPAVLPQQ